MDDVGCAEFEDDNARADADAGQCRIDKRGEEKIVKVSLFFHGVVVLFFMIRILVEC